MRPSIEDLSVKFVGRNFSTPFLYLSDAEDAHMARKYRQLLFIHFLNFFFTFEFLILCEQNSSHRIPIFLKLCKTFVYGLDM